MRRIKEIAAILLAPAVASAEEPLSAIEWLNEPAPITVAQPLMQSLTEPIVRNNSTSEVTVTALDSASLDAVGLLVSSTTGLPKGIWGASETSTLVSHLESISETPLPAMQALYYTLLLAEADPPADVKDDARFLRARIATLRRFGAIDAAVAMLERAGPETQELFNDWHDIALLLGAEGAPCAALTRQPDLSRDYARRIFCWAREGDWPTAALTFGSASILDEFSSEEKALLAMFLDPEFAEAAPDPVPSRDVTPLIFRLYEAIGKPVPTGTLAREFAFADLRGTMGWKAEIEAAERLTRSGALPVNHLLGLYTERSPAASGGVWERVRAIQALEKAISSGDPDQIASKLPRAWDVMYASGLAVALAALFGEDLIAYELPEAQEIATKMVLLSPVFDRIGEYKASQSKKVRFLISIAQGSPLPHLARSSRERAIAAAFTVTGPAPSQTGMLSEGRLGEAIIAAAAQLDAAGRNQAADIEAALATLRFVGLEDIARQAALQILLLETPQ